MARDGSGKGGGQGSEQVNSWKQSKRAADIAEALEKTMPEEPKK